MVELRGAEELRVEYHQRLSLAAAPLTLFLLAIVLATRRRLSQRAAAAAACLATVIIVFVLMIGGALSDAGLVPPPVGAWLFHFVALTASILLAAATRARTGPPEGWPPEATLALAEHAPEHLDAVHRHPHR